MLGFRRIGIDHLSVRDHRFGGCSGLRRASGARRTGSLRTLFRGVCIGAVSDHQTLNLRFDAALDRFVGNRDHRLPIIDDLDEGLADLHGKLVAVFIEEDHAVVQILRFRAIAHPCAADVMAVLEDLADALSIESDDRARGIAVHEGNVRANHDHVSERSAFSGQHIGVGLAISISIVQTGSLIVLICGQICGRSGLVRNDDAVHAFAASEAGIIKEESMRFRRCIVFFLDLIHDERDIIRSNVITVAGAIVPDALLLVHQLSVGIGELSVRAVFLNPFLDAGRAALIAEEVIRRAPHLSKRCHRDTRGTNRTSDFGVVAHEQGNLAGRTISLNGKLVNQIGGSDSPVRQGTGMGVDVDQHGSVFALPAFAGNGIDSALRRIFVRNGHLDLL